MATRSPWPASTWRSTQLYATLSLPPTNHLANGASDQSNTSSNGVSQDSRSACLAQNARRSSSASRYSSSRALACSAKCAGGGYDEGASALVAVTGFSLGFRSSTVCEPSSVITRPRGGKAEASFVQSV